MQASRLQLQHYNLTHVHVEPIAEAPSPELGAYADFDNAELSTETELSGIDGPDSRPKHVVGLTVDAKPKDGRPFPYRFTVGLIGVFDGNELPPEHRDELVYVNGTSMLYGVAREVLLSLTSRCVQGPVLLPSVQFTELAEKIASQKSPAKQG